jgi:hypothetical protein
MQSTAIYSATCAFRLFAVPIRARDRCLGTLTLVNVGKERPCGPNELSLAEELGQRAAPASKTRDSTKRLKTPATKPNGRISRKIVFLPCSATSCAHRSPQS